MHTLSLTTTKSWASHPQKETEGNVYEKEDSSEVYSSFSHCINPPPPPPLVINSLFTYIIIIVKSCWQHMQHGYKTASPTIFSFFHKRNQKGTKLHLTLTLFHFPHIKQRQLPSRNMVAHILAACKQDQKNSTCNGKSFYTHQHAVSTFITRHTRGLSISAGGGVRIVGSDDGHVHYRPWWSGRIAGSDDSHGHYSPWGRGRIVGSDDSHVYYSPWGSGRIAGSDDGHVHYSPWGRGRIVGSDNGHVHYYPWGRGRIVGNDNGHVHYSPWGKGRIVGSDNGHVHYSPWGRGRIVGSDNGHVHYSPWGSGRIVGSDDGHLHYCPWMLTEHNHRGLKRTAERHHREGVIFCSEEQQLLSWHATAW